jgi:K+-sensing histidine kinase KdpD
MQSENIYVNIEEININIIIRDIINYYEQNSNLKNITIQQDFSDDITINTDKNMFSAIIRNVINNAIKFSPQNSVINIDVKKNNNHAKIFIKDFGIGISQNIKDKILISKVEKSEDGTLDEKGSSFGYYLINFFVDKLGYEFKIYDNVPHGTIFELSCPLS